MQCHVKMDITQITEHVLNVLQMLKNVILVCFNNVMTDSILTMHLAYHVKQEQKLVNHKTYH